jgi:hypothetical protein
MGYSLTNLGMILPLFLNAPAPEKVEPPKGPPPELQMVSSLDRDKGTITVVTVRQVPEQKFKVVVEEVNQGGKIFKVNKQLPVIEYVSVTVMMSYRLSDESVSATDVFGKKLAKNGVWNMLTPGKMIAVARDRNGLDPAYRAALARDVVILIVPPPEAPGDAKPLPEK